MCIYTIPWATYVRAHLLENTHRIKHIRVVQQLKRKVNENYFGLIQCKPLFPPQHVSGVIYFFAELYFFTFEDLPAHRVEDVSLVVEATDLAEQPLHLRLRAPDAHDQHGSARDYLPAELLPWWATAGGKKG